MKIKLWKKLLTASLCAAMTLSSMFVTTFAGEPAAAAETFQKSTLLDGNLHEQDYNNWSYCINSYLVQDGSGYIRVESPRYRDRGENDTILVGYYDHDLKLQSERRIPQELGMFGGFYAGTDSYYIVFGQENTEEDDNKEVVRVVKYDKDWTRLGAASLCGANTTIPFNAGSLRMTAYGGYLYIRTSHEMYNGHQANLTIQVQTDNMEITDYFAEVWNIEGGYVSHSFNQFILVDDDANLVAMDHGDANPRSLVLGKYAQKAGASTFFDMFSYDYTDLMVFPEAKNIHYNYTGASAGGLEYSNTHYLAAGNSVVQDSDWENRDARNIFVATAARNNLSDTKITWITDYKDSENLSASTPQLVKLSGDSFLLLWEQLDYNEYEYPGKICYIFLDGSGNPVSDIYTGDGYLSDCKPIYDGENVVWYAYDSQMAFYKIDTNGSLSCIRETTPLSACAVKLKNADKTYVYSGKEKKPAVKVTSELPEKYTLKKGKDYTVEYKNNTDVGVAEVEITGIGDYEGTASLTFQIVPKGTTLSAPKALKNGLKVQWKKQTTQTSGYEIQYAQNKKFTKSPASITVGRKKTSAKISRLKANKTYYVRIRTYKTVTDGETSQDIYSAWSSAQKVKTK